MVTKTRSQYTIKPDIQGSSKQSVQDTFEHDVLGRFRSADFGKVSSNGSFSPLGWMKMENQSLEFSYHLTLDPFVIPPGGKYPIFVFGIAIYLFGMFCNLTLLFLIILKRNLHKPMYFILFGLPFNDLIGITATLPKILSDIVTETHNI